MADASSCARCGSDSADPRQFIRHGSAIDEAYCNSCWPIVAEELSGSSSEIDPEKMKWIHEVMEGEEGPHPGDDIFDAFKPPRVFINVREYPPENWNRKGDEELGLATRHGTHDDIAWDELMDDFAERGGEGPNLDDRLDGPDRIPGFHPTNTFIPFRSPKDKSIYFGGKRTQQAVDALGDKNIDFRASEDPFDYAWDMVVKMPWFYHATPSSNRMSIATEGIKPGIDGLVYASKDPELAARWIMFTNRQAPEIDVLPFWREEDDPTKEPGVDHSPIMTQMLMGSDHEPSEDDAVTFADTIKPIEILPNMVAEGTPDNEDRSAGNPGWRTHQNPFHDPEFEEKMNLLREMNEKRQNTE